jgi:hypothetical protein
LTTHFDGGPGGDEGPGLGPDDPLAVILRPASDYLGPPAGRYRTIRRGAARRKALRAAAGAALTCAVATLVVLPFRLAAHEGPASPAVPLAPPPMSSPTPTPSTSKDPNAVPSTAATRPSQSSASDLRKSATARGRSRPTSSTQTAVPTRTPTSAGASGTPSRSATTPPTPAG